MTPRLTLFEDWWVPGWYARELFEQRGPLGWLYWRKPEIHNPGYGSCAVIQQAGHTRVLFRATGRSARAANIVWLMHTDQWPHKRLHRRNGDSRDDRFANLYMKGEPDLPDLV